MTRNHQAQEWDTLRALLAREIDGMRFRLEAVSDQDLDDFVTELTDRLFAQVTINE